MIEPTIKDGIMIGFGFIIAKVVTTIPIIVLCILSGYKTNKQVLEEIKSTLQNIDKQLSKNAEGAKWAITIKYLT